MNESNNSGQRNRFTNTFPAIKSENERKQWQSFWNERDISLRRSETFICGESVRETFDIYQRNTIQARIVIRQIRRGIKVGFCWAEEVDRPGKSLPFSMPAIFSTESTLLGQFRNRFRSHHDDPRPQNIHCRKHRIQRSIDVRIRRRRFPAQLDCRGPRFCRRNGGPNRNISLFPVDTYVRLRKICGRKQKPVRCRFDTRFFW